MKKILFLFWLSMIIINTVDASKPNTEPSPAAKKNEISGIEVYIERYGQHDNFCAWNENNKNEPFKIKRSTLYTPLINHSPLDAYYLQAIKLVHTKALSTGYIEKNISSKWNISEDGKTIEFKYMLRSPNLPEDE